MKRTVVLTLLLSFALVMGLSAQEKDTRLKELPGYVDFDQLFHFQNAQETVEVFLKEPLLSLIAAASDSELANILSNLKQIRVQSYTLDSKQLKDIPALFSDVAGKLERKNWYLVVSVKDASDWTHVYMKNAGKKIAGMVVVTLDRANHEITFVNLVGNIDIAALSSLSGQFSIPQLDSIRASKPGRGGKK